MSPLYAVVAFIVVQRLLELAVSRRNARTLLAQGGIEFGRGHYPLIVALHAGWLLALVSLVSVDAPLSMPLLAVFALLQVARAWTLKTLGRFWTTRVVVLPRGQRIRTGPFRFIDHPNYLIVSIEIAVVPLMFGAWQLAAAASVLNLLVLRNRIRVENRALAKYYGS